MTVTYPKMALHVDLNASYLTNSAAGTCNTRQQSHFYMVAEFLRKHFTATRQFFSLEVDIGLWLAGYIWRLSSGSPVTGDRGTTGPIAWGKKL